MDPDQIAPRVLLAELHSLTGEHERAMEIIDHAISISPEEVDLHLSRGSILIRQQRHQEADSAIRTALSLSPEHVEALRLSAFNAGALGRTSEAREHLSQALQNAPDNADVLAVLAWQEYTSGRSGDHPANFRHVLANEPEHGLALLGLRLSSSMWPEYHAFILRHVPHLVTRQRGFTSVVQLVYGGLLLLLCWCWYRSGWRPDLGPAVLLMPIALPLMMLLTVPAFLQLNTALPQKFRSLYKGDQRSRIIVAGLSVPCAIGLFVLDLATPMRSILAGLVSVGIGVMAIASTDWYNTRRKRIGIFLACTALLVSAPPLYELDTGLPNVLLFCIAGMLGTMAFLLISEHQ